MMHNVRLSNIQKKYSECKESSEAATVQFNLQGEWRTSSDDKQFGGTLLFPQGELNLEADFPPFLGGEGRAPSALAYCFYGAMSCYGSTFATQAAMAGLEIETLKINLNLSVDFRCALGIGSFPPLKGFEFKVNIQSGASNDDIQKIKKLTDERCPAIWAMQNPVPFTTTAVKVS